jgi:hypothetical protein
LALTPGTRLGVYDVIAQIGAGGMGEVYRARDTKLDRDVALKLLPESFASDPERLRRFEREAKTLASLNHTNIAQIYGIVDADGRQALVMELVAGRTLDEFVQAHAGRSGAGVPVSDAVAIAAQIAEALETAHEAGIVHRDLKPANVMVRDDGVVKVLDFGLARPADTAAATAFSSPTMLSPAMTGHGVILGTASYMSPEQAKGRTADKRSDIWAFGVVLHEMLTGRRLFRGETVTEVIAAVLKDAPNLAAVPASTPPVLRRLLERCLERDPRLRLRDIGEARIALARLDGATDDGRTGQNAPDRTRSPVRALAYALGMVAVAATAGIMAWISKPAPAPAPNRRFELPRPIGESSSFALAPDGRRIAYVHRGHLYVHALDSGIASDLVAIPPSPTTVFWSPDSRTIGVTVDASVKTIPASGGTLFTVCRVPASGLVIAARWQPDSTILFAVWRDSLYRVSALGGTPELHTAIDAATEVDFHSIEMLPDNRLAVTTHVRGGDGARLDVIAGGRRTPLASPRDINGVRFQPPDKLLFLRIGVNAGVWAAPLGASLDLARAALLEPGAIDFDAAADGTLVASFLPKDRRELIWVTRRGEITALPGVPFDTGTGDIVLSPDGRRAVLSVRAADLTAHFVVRDLATGADTPIPAPETVSVITSSAAVSWTPAQRLLYAAGGIESSRIHDWPSDGSTGGRALTDGLDARMVADGSQVLFLRDERGALRLFRAPVQADGSLGPAAPVFAERDAPQVRTFDVSPDGRLLAFTTTDSDTQQLNVIVTTLPDLRERRQVTSSGGNSPRFSRDGRELYFKSGQRDNAGLTRGQLNLVSIRANPLTVGVPETVLVAGENGGPTISGFDIASDGRLLMTRKAPAAAGDEGRAVLRQNWMAAISK